MAISGRPPRPAQAAELRQEPDEQTVRKLIHKGGSVAEAGRTVDPESIKPKLVQLRLYPDMLQDIDAVREKTPMRRRRKLSRHEWILQAIEEKLAREKEL
jgi:hypothetical protein